MSLSGDLHERTPTYQGLGPSGTDLPLGLSADLFTAYLIEDEWLTLHVWAGYTVLGLIGFRILWGFIGPRHARFSDFFYSPAEILTYIKDLLRFRNKRYLGHNPAGSAMIFVLLMVLLLIGLSGLIVYGIEEHAGPFAGLVAAGEEEAWEETEDFLEETHALLADFAVILVALHVLGVMVESIIHRENLVRAMFTGRKRAP